MFDVTIDRDKYIGGSDIPVIMGISPFKTRWELLMEKADPSLYEQKTSAAIEYGNVMEPKIRDFVNRAEFTKFVPDQKIIGDLRANVDGFDGKQILEIKTTSHVCYNIKDYKHYLVQLLFYMNIYKVQEGILAVYERPEDYDEEFCEDRLEIFYVDIERYKELLEQIENEIDKFRLDLERVKENPLLTEQDLQPKAVVEAANWATQLDLQLHFFKQIESEYKAAKDILKQQMEKHSIKTWIMNNGTRITLVPDGEDSVVQELDVNSLKNDMPNIYAQYLINKTKKGRVGYIKITPKKDG